MMQWKSDAYASFVSTFWYWVSAYKPTNSFLNSPILVVAFLIPLSHSIISNDIQFNLMGVTPGVKDDTLEKLEAYPGFQIFHKGERNQNGCDYPISMLNRSKTQSPYIRFSLYCVTAVRFRRGGWRAKNKKNYTCNEPESTILKFERSGREAV